MLGLFGTSQGVLCGSLMHSKTPFVSQHLDLSQCMQVWACKAPVAFSSYVPITSLTVQADEGTPTKPRSGVSSLLGRSKAESAAARDGHSINLHAHAAQTEHNAHAIEDFDEGETFVSPR